VSSPRPPTPDVDGRLAIHYAAMNGHSLTVLTLAAYGADVNSCTKNGRTALHGACWNGHTQAALQLIEMGADCNSRAGTNSQE
jgi:cytohesin